MSTGKLLARDAYLVWKRMVAGATTSVRVFTPYLDALLAQLLGNAAVPEAQISVVTDLSPGAGSLTYRRQLLGLRQLLKAGIEVRSLPRLHAKVLVTDGEQVTVGSQNFTTYARGSHETTVVRVQPIGDPRFLATLDAWYDEASVVDLALIETLLEGLEDELKAEADAHVRVVAKYEDLVEAHRARQRRQAVGVRHPSFGGRLERATQAASARLAQSSLDSWLDLTSGYYTALVVGEFADLTRWLVREGDSTKTVRLTRLYMHPILLAPSGRMGFARLATTRSTYVRFSVNRSQFRVGGVPLNVRVQFPEDPVDANIEMLLTPAAPIISGGINLRLAFDGTSFEVVSSDLADHQPFRYRDYYWGEWIAPDIERLLAALREPGTVASLTAFALRPFRYSELGIYDKNADDFFPKRCTLTLAQVGEQNILIARER